MSIFKRSSVPSNQQSDDERRFIWVNKARLNALCRLLGIVFSEDHYGNTCSAHFIEKNKEPKK